MKMERGRPGTAHAAAIGNFGAIDQAHGHRHGHRPLKKTWPAPPAPTVTVSTDIDGGAPLT